jgi:transposase
MNDYSKAAIRMVVGLDVSDKKTTYMMLDLAHDEVIQEGKVATNEESLRVFFAGLPKVSRVVLETGSHSPWISRLAEEYGHQVVVANARKTRLIFGNDYKDDPIDAEYLARLGRADVKLLFPVRHRGAEAHADLAVVKARDGLVQVRTKLILQARGLVKPFGGRLPRCSAEAFPNKVRDSVPRELRPAVLPLLQAIARLTAQIRQFDKKVARFSRKYPDTAVVAQVPGVGAIVSAGFILTLEDPSRLAHSRKAGPFMGLVPGRAKSGLSDPERRITKAGNSFMRRLLLQSAHYILGPFCQDCELRRFGLKLYERGGKTRKAKRRAAVAVARKVAVLMHRLWKTGEVYEPLYHEQQRAQTGVLVANVGQDPITSGV